MLIAVIFDGRSTCISALQSENSILGRLVIPSGRVMLWMPVAPNALYPKVVSPSGSSKLVKEEQP